MHLKRGVHAIRTVVQISYNHLEEKIKEMKKTHVNILDIEHHFFTETERAEDP